MRSRMSFAGRWPDGCALPRFSVQSVQVPAVGVAVFDCFHAMVDRQLYGRRAPIVSLAVHV
jgi:hypothetical protein